MHIQDSVRNRAITAEAIFRGLYECSLGNKITASYLHLTFVSIKMNTQVYIMDEQHSNHAQKLAYCVPNLKNRSQALFYGRM